MGQTNSLTDTARLTEQVWEAFAEPLRVFLRRRVSNEANADDLLQEVFLKIHTQIGTLRAKEKLAPWVYQIARHELIDFYRRQRPHEALSAAETVAEEQPDWEDEEMRSDLASAVLAMLDCLPAAQREALLLTDFQGLSQKELGERLGLSFSGAKSRVQRARSHLRQLFQTCCHLAFDRFGRVIDYQARCVCCQEHNATREIASTSATGCCVLSSTSTSVQEDAGDCSCTTVNET